MENKLQGKFLNATQYLNRQKELNSRNLNCTNLKSECELGFSTNKEYLLFDENENNLWHKRF